MVLPVLVLLCVLPPLVVAKAVSDWFVVVWYAVDVELPDAVAVKLPTIELPDCVVVCVAVAVVVAVTFWTWNVVVTVAVLLSVAVAVVVEVSLAVLLAVTVAVLAKSPLIEPDVPWPVWVLVALVVANTVSAWLVVVWNPVDVTRLVAVTVAVTARMSLPDSRLELLSFSKVVDVTCCVWSSDVSLVVVDESAEEAATKAPLIQSPLRVSRLPPDAVLVAVAVSDWLNVLRTLTELDVPATVVE
jgi:hypothetical protein